MPVRGRPLDVAPARRDRVASLTACALVVEEEVEGWRDSAGCEYGLAQPSDSSSSNSSNSSNSSKGQGSWIASNGKAGA
jgi:hypothetical protein